MLSNVFWRAHPSYWWAPRSRRRTRPPSTFQVSRLLILIRPASSGAAQPYSAHTLPYADCLTLFITVATGLPYGLVDSLTRLAERILPFTNGDFQPSQPPMLLEKLTDQLLVVASDVVAAVATVASPTLTGFGFWRGCWRMREARARLWIRLWPKQSASGSRNKRRKCAIRLLLRLPMLHRRVMLHTRPQPRTLVWWPRSHLSSRPSMRPSAGRMRARGTRSTSAFTRQISIVRA